MTELLLNPDMSSKVREEVSAKVGEDVPHKTETEVKLGEYVVRKNTQIIVNAWAMARDQSYWEDPVMFKPEGFIAREVYRK
ncbi:geraniol 8-hydroxylase-like protein [Tanacetum coccineum]